ILHPQPIRLLTFFFSTLTSPSEIYTLSLHDALPICAFGVTSREVMKVAGPYKVRVRDVRTGAAVGPFGPPKIGCGEHRAGRAARSEEHTSELQSLAYLVCRLLLEKKKAFIGFRVPEVLRDTYEKTGVAGRGGHFCKVSQFTTHRNQLSYPPIHSRSFRTVPAPFHR